MNYVSKLFTGTVLLSLSACGSNNTSSTGAGGGDGGSGSTTSSGEGGASNTTTSVGGGGVGGMGEGGAGGGSGCTQITFADLAPAQVNAAGAVYLGDVAPSLGGVAPDNLSAEFYGPDTGSFDGGLTGSFDLTMNGDDNYSTCSRCLLVEEDGANKVYFQSQGTLVIDPGSQQLTGFLDASVTGLRLVEVTVDGTTFVSTPVPNGACLEIAAADLNAGMGLLAN